LLRDDSHNNSPQSQNILKLLHEAKTTNWKAKTSKASSASSGEGTDTEGAPLEFEINETVNQPPTASQISTILSYLKTPLGTLVSSHPSAASTRADSIEALVEAANQNPKVFRFPIVCHWEAGMAALDVGGTSKILEKIAEEQRSSKSSSRSGWFS
jgi:arsenate reductase-like glutaredoxin family protein